MARRFKTIKTGPVRGPVIVKSSFSNKKLAGIMDDMMAEQLNIMGKNINDAIQNGIDIGLDINDNRIEPLAPSTLAKRQAKGHGTKPLDISGKMRETKLTQASRNNQVYTIEMVGKSSRTGKVYGAFHNQGYTNSSKSRFPGAKVPKRNWFGIPKQSKPGGSDYKKAMAQIRLRLKRGWKFI